MVYNQDKMADIFDNTILCKDCNKKMQKSQILKNGFMLRAMICDKCGERLIHPVDNENYNKFVNLRNKEFSVKMRLVGNSYAVSIPKEIVSFMNNQERVFKDFDKMVRLCFEEMGKLSLNFGNNVHEKARVVKSREVKIVKNNKPVFHSKQFYDSAHPEKNFKTVKKAQEEE